MAAAAPSSSSGNGAADAALDLAQQCGNDNDDDLCGDEDEDLLHVSTDPDQTPTLVVNDDDRLVVNWRASSTCFGQNRKYVRDLVDGTVVGGAPLTNPVGHTSAFPPVATEASVTIEGVASVAPGAHTVTVETAIDTTASCTIGPASGDGGGGGGRLLSVQVLE